MARIRTIKPDFFTSEDITDLSFEARLLYIATWLEADKEGRLPWKPKTLKMRYFPADDLDIVELCQELIDLHLVILYGDGLAYIPTFRQHQHINPRETNSALPEPPARQASPPANTTGDDLDDNPLGPVDVHENCTRAQRVATRHDASVTHREEGRKGREGKGNKHPSAKNDEIPPEFFEFWDAYPKKVAKPQAIRAWRKLNPDTTTTQAIVAAVGRDRRSDQWLRDGGQYIPHPASYLNAARWEDEVEVLDGAQIGSQVRLSGGFVG
ncbi:MAG: hypothetical protein ACEQSH_00595 [Bacteroidia bacterium]